MRKLKGYVSEERFTFRPTAEEQIILDEQNVRWSEFCHQKIKELKEKDTETIYIKKDMFFNHVLSRLVAILICIFIPLISHIFSSDPVILMVEYLVSITILTISVYSLLIIMKNRRRYYGRKL
jgi:hypothetical protein